MKTQEAIDQITRLITQTGARPGKLSKGDVNRDIAFFISTIDDPTSRMLAAGLVRSILRKGEIRCMNVCSTMVGQILQDMSCWR